MLSVQQLTAVVQKDAAGETKCIKYVTLSWF